MKLSKGMILRRGAHWLRIEKVTNKKVLAAERNGNTGRFTAKPVAFDRDKLKGYKEVA